MENMGKIKIVVLHLLPGVMINLGYLMALKIEALNSLPRSILLGISGSICAVIFELGYLLYITKKETGSYNIFRILGYKKVLSLKANLGYTFVLIMTVGALMKLIGPFSEKVFEQVFFFISTEYNFVQDMSLFSKNLIIWATVVSFLNFTLLVPIIEELYFRGYLLPRMKWMGSFGVIVHTLLFAVYHFWSPWLILARFIALTPLFYIVYKKKSILLGIFVHCLANFMTVIELLIIIMNS
ncbi:MAG: CPBP family intramembrane metalloprotease [Clostridiales bacterium]|nr:CPBP family intramembrane metalloprotease [Clostridiales bacterium]